MEMHKLFLTKLCASQMCNSWTRTWLPVTTRWNTATKPKEFTTFYYNNGLIRMLYTRQFQSQLLVVRCCLSCVRWAKDDHRQTEAL